MESLTFWTLCVLVLLAVTPSVILMILLVRMLPLWRVALTAQPALLERAMDLLSARSANEFLRTQTTHSSSLLYPPNDGPATEPEKPQTAYQKALADGVPDDIAQFLEDE